MTNEELNTKEGIKQAILEKRCLSCFRHLEKGYEYITPCNDCNTYKTVWYQLHLPKYVKARYL